MVVLWLNHPCSWRLSVLATVLLVCASTAHAAPEANFEVAFPNLRFNKPVYITFPPDGSDRLFVLEQDGRVLWFNNQPGVEQAHLAIDLRRRVRRSNPEEGLLGLAFHPDFKTNGQVFLHYSASRPRRNVLARFEMDLARKLIDPATEQVLLEVKQPYGNHNGGMIQFGPDGYLYVSLGDGGETGDPHNHAQNTATLLGAILRLDVDHQQPGLSYAIPQDNPLVDNPNARGEIWAYGLRNAWRFSFDRATGRLWAGDVGQFKWEEIDLITKGGNYGWNLWEGNHRYDRREEPGPFIKPIMEHERGQAQSITGGYVYRGQQVPTLHGAYVYGDFATGLIGSLRYDGQKVTQHDYLAHVLAISSFGEDQNGELYLTSYYGQIYKMLTIKP